MFTDSWGWLGTMILDWNIFSLWKTLRLGLIIIKKKRIISVKMSSNNWTWSYYMSSSSCLWKTFLRDITQHTSHVGTYLLFSFLGDDPEPVSNHTEHSGKVCQAHHDPETHHRLVVVQVLWTLWPTCRTKDTKKRGYIRLCVGYMCHSPNHSEKKSENKRD